MHPILHLLWLWRTRLTYWRASIEQATHPLLRGYHSPIMDSERLQQGLFRGFGEGLLKLRYQAISGEVRQPERLTSGARRDKVVPKSQPYAVAGLFSPGPEQDRKVLTDESVH